MKTVKQKTFMSSGMFLLPAILLATVSVSTVSMVTQANIEKPFYFLVTSDSPWYGLAYAVSSLWP